MSSVEKYVYTSVSTFLFFLKKGVGDTVLGFSNPGSARQLCSIFPERFSITFWKTMLNMKLIYVKHSE